MKTQLLYVQKSFSKQLLNSMAVRPHPDFSVYLSLCPSVFLHFRFAFPKLLEQCSQGNSHYEIWGNTIFIFIDIDFFQKCIALLEAVQHSQSKHVCHAVRWCSLTIKGREMFDFIKLSQRSDRKSADCDLWRHLETSLIARALQHLEVCYTELTVMVIKTSPTPTLL